MPTPKDTFVQIPAQDDGGAPSKRRWLISMIVMAGLAALALLEVNTRPPQPAYRWSPVQGPLGAMNLDSLVALKNRFAVLSGITEEGVLLWWTDESGEWVSQVMDGSPTQLASGANRLAAYRVRTGEVLVPDGDGWATEHEIDFPAETRTRQASGRPSVVVMADAILELSLFGDVWWSPSGGSFTRVIENPTWGQGLEQPFRSACLPPNRSSPDVAPIIVTDGALMALVPSQTDEPFGVWPVCEPLLWWSHDGSDWSSETTNISGDGNYVYDLAWRDGLLVAVGGRGLDQAVVWSSIDGVNWRDVTPETNRSVVIHRVEAGGAGWVILGQDTLESVGWTSADGSCWEPLEPPIGGTEAVVTDEEILIVDRSSYPDMWLAIPTGSKGTCR